VCAPSPTGSPEERRALERAEIDGYLVTRLGPRSRLPRTWLAWCARVRRPALWIRRDGLSGVLTLAGLPGLASVEGSRAIGAVLDSLGVPGEWTPEGAWTATLPLPAAERHAQVIVALAEWKAPARP
jgi:hypothetical protein